MNEFRSIRVRKRALRAEMRTRILALDPAERARQESALAELFPTLPGFAEAHSVMLYVTAFPEEIDTKPYLRLALAQGKRLICPHVDSAGRRLRLFEIADLAADLTTGVLGIPEPKPDRPECGPEEVDWVLVPGLAFDERGFRLGRGAGYYDRFLPTLRQATPRWALALAPQCVHALPTEAHDQPIDGIASPCKVLHTCRENPTIF